MLSTFRVNLGFTLGFWASACRITLGSGFVKAAGHRALRPQTLNIRTPKDRPYAGSAGA